MAPGRVSKKRKRTTCEHNKRKDSCVKCSGCIHGKFKHNCKECGGSAYCTHGIRKTRCKECGGSAYCTHGIRKDNCVICSGCIHGKLKHNCKECGGSALCKSEWCSTRANKRYDGYCMPCFVNNPENKDKPAMRNYKTKEKQVVDEIKEEYPDFSWVSDKRVQDGCSLRRPDLLLDMGSNIIIIEVDENKHINYDSTCENKRLMELSQDLQHRPIVFIRFNPDSYKDNEGKIVKSCWKLNKSGIMSIINNRDWEKRIETLKQNIKYYIENPPKKTIEIVELFY